ncbi:transglycosylase SLT domain-containing protein [Marinobacterium litorale]|uniref:transglycosylase SLT domain-containing protein n=1 Tax=Marinobacterium litorale TaxID=404770 RepID=UPI00042222CF|nr:transglycosylase SLT domain-containing protein [Marinobacterium litorale]
MRQHLHRAFITLLMLTPATSVNAALNEQQTLFKATLTAAENGDQSAVDEGLEKLGDYPLRPYIEYAELRSKLDTLSLSDVQQFSNTYPDIPLEGRLRWAFTEVLGKRGQWTQFDQLYATLDRPSTEHECYAALSQLAQGNRKTAFNEAARLWSVGYSQPDACDPLFNAWMKAGELKDEHAFKRVIAALSNGRPSLARYAERKAQHESTQKRIALAFKLYREPGALATNPQLLTLSEPAHRDLLILAVNRLRRADLDRAIELWIRDRERLQLPFEEQAHLTTRLGLYKAKRFSEASEAQLARLDPDYRLGELTEWRARLALTRLDWPAVEALIGKLPPERAGHERWQYWLSVSLQRQGQDVSERLQQISQDRTFYGFLAAELGQHPFTLAHEPAVFDAGALERLAAEPAFRRMKELYELDELYDARSEWNLATRGLPLDQQQLASHLVNSWGWHTQGIRGAIQSERWNDLDIRFPDPYRSLFEEHAQKNGITTTWATAIARQESAFWVNARSHAGALGLMQLMPATARGTARRHGLPLNNLSALYDPATNIAIGSAYLGEMYQRFDGNRVYATAAYNAGPHRVKRWLEARQDLPLDIWIETIPFDETRNYVQNVLAFGVIYDERAGRSARLLSNQERALLAFYKAGDKETL